jgi:hypothetical protein
MHQYPALQSLKIRALQTLVPIVGVTIGLLTTSTSALAQSQTSNQTGSVNNALNSPIFQSNPQNSVPVTNANTTNIRIPNIYPLQNLPHAHVNTENDFGMNLSVGVNTLDASNVTVYMGFVFQPGRTEDHKLRMNRLRKETEVLEANLTLLQTQIESAKLQLDKLKK